MTNLSKFSNPVDEIERHFNIPSVLVHCFDKCCVYGRLTRHFLSTPCSFKGPFESFVNWNLPQPFIGILPTHMTKGSATFGQRTRKSKAILSRKRHNELVQASIAGCTCHKLLDVYPEPESTRQVGKIVHLFDLSLVESRLSPYP